MSEEKNIDMSDIEKKAMRNIARAENMPIAVDRKIPGSDMAVMTIIAIIAVICIAVSIVVSATAPTSSKELQPKTAQQPLAAYAVSDYSHLPEGVAAEVNGVEISEQMVTDYVDSYRKSMDLENEDEWAQFIFEGESYGNTENLRNFVLNMIINQELVIQAAESIGVVVTDEQIDEIIKDDMKKREIATEEEYWDLVLASGFTEEGFIAQNRNSLLQNEIVYYTNPESGYIDDLDEMVLQYVKDSYPAYSDITSLDEVSENISGYSREYVIYLLNTKAYNAFMEDFIKNSSIEVAAPPEDLPYAVDTAGLQIQSFIDDFKQKMESQSQHGGQSNEELEGESIEGISSLESPEQPAAVESAE